MNLVHDWQTYFGVLDATHGGTRTLEQHAAMNPNGMLDATPPAEGLSSSSVAASISGSCWLCVCPDCGGAELVNFDDLRFFCCACRNRKTRAKPRPVVVPDELERAAIETVLLERPDPRTRNWSPGESVADLEAENQEAGI
jgi:hypothetical protein